jgi:hypothetical protein
MRRILHEVAKLEPAEVDFIMELSMMQKRARAGMDNRMVNPALDKDRAQHFLNSLYAIAQADGITSSEEIVEIETIAAEFGLTSSNHSKLVTGNFPPTITNRLESSRVGTGSRTRLASSTLATYFCRTASSAIDSATCPDPS